MTFNQLTDLIKAGFNEDQIKAIYKTMEPGTGTETSATAGHAPQAGPAISPNPSPSPAPDPIPPTTATAGSPGVTTETAPTASPNVAVNEPSETQKMVAEILGLMQKGFINNLSTNAQPKTETAEDILAHIMDP